MNVWTEEEDKRLQSLQDEGGWMHESSSDALRVRMIHVWCQIRGQTLVNLIYCSFKTSLNVSVVRGEMLE